MKKTLLITLLLLTAYIAAFAIPAKRNTARTVRLSDGTEVVVYLKGDEYAHWWESKEGQIFKFDDEGNVLQMEAADVQKIRSRGTESREARNQIRGKRMAQRQNTRNAIIGEKKGLVILVNFKNKEMVGTSPQNAFRRQFNENGYSDNGHVGSVADYFYDQSYGQLTIDFDVVGPVTVSQNYSYYGQNDSYGDDLYPCTMVAEACRLADAEVDFADYDWDGDGEVDQVFIVYAGYGEASGASANTIWPHEWLLSEGAEYGDGEGALTLDNTRIDTYAVSCELAGTSGSVMDGIGTACHEFSHCLGYPDFYDTSFSGSGWGMAAWDIMDTGSYNGPNYNGEVPSGYTSYERMMAGWLQPTELTDGMEVEALKPLADSPEAYILYNDNNKNEYYLLENRRAEKWFSYVEDYEAPSGMLIIHVDYDESAWNNNTPNSIASHQRMTIFQANNKKGSLGSYGYILTEAQYQGHLYPYNANDSLTNNSLPKATLYNANTDGSNLMNKGIYSIKNNSDGTMSFNCRSASSSNNGGGTGGGNDNPTTGNIIFYESFDQCQGTGGNDDRWSGSIAQGTFIPDNEGWDYFKVAGAYMCAKFGTGSVLGDATTPTFTLEGDAVLSFKAGIWDNEKDGKSLNVTVNDEIIETYDIARGEWTDITLTISGNGDTRVGFVPELRFFLDEVKVVQSDPTGIKNLDVIDAAEDRIFNISGQYVGNDAGSLPAGIYIIKGKKIIRK